MASSSSDGVGGAGIALNVEEQRLFDLLNSVVAELAPQTTLRCAGGWVRDKLLGKDSHDIDIAIDNMMGEEFAHKLNEYLVAHGGEEANVAVIHSNPDQSKHLETAKVNYQGLEIDLVNLRSESYAEESRIPEIKFGTAKEDALRRDFTINALFYNIRLGTVEDLTEKGLEDLKKGLIRTPLPALQTFTDDPLRVMRAIRFASRLGFDLDQDIVTSAATSEVQQALATKVSRERISTELESTLQGPNPKMALELVRTFDLLDVILDMPREVREGLPADYAEPCIECAAFMAEAMRGELEEFQVSPQHAKKVGILAALLLPLRDLSVLSDKNKEVGLTEHIIGLCLKKKKDAALAAMLQRAAGDIREACGRAGTEAEGATAMPDEAKVKLGLAIRSARDLWKVAARLAHILDLPFGNSLKGEGGASGGAGQGSSGQGKDTENAALFVSRVEEKAVALKLDKAWQIKPLINGKELMGVLNARGPIIGKAVAEMINWQLVHPEGSIEDCLAFLLEVKPKLQ